MTHRTSVAGKIARVCEVLAASLLFAGVPSWAVTGTGERGDTLPRIGYAPAFALTDQDGRRFFSAAQRGKVVVVTFIFAGCSDSCPVLTAKLVGIQRKLAREASKVVFVAITVDPLNDTPPRLKKYAQAHSANLSNFAFLTGSPAQVNDAARRYAVFRKTNPGGNIDHAFLTSLVDYDGMLRVQYLGTRFDPAEFEAGVRSLLAEQAR